MADINWQWDTKSSAFLADKKIQRAVERAAKKAGGDALRALRAEAKRQTRNRVRIKASHLANRALPLTFARGRKLADLVWRMDVSGAPVPLGEYPSRATKKGVSVEIERGRRSIIQGAFIRQRKDGKRGVFRRPKGSTRYSMGHRLGMRTSDTMQDGQIPRASLTRSSSVFAAAMERLTKLEINR